MTLSAFAWNIARTYTLLGTASNLVMYVSASDNDDVGVTGTFLGTAAQGVWSTALLGAAGRNREAALRSFQRLDPRAGAAVGGHVRASAF